MNFLAENWLLILVALASGTMLLQPMLGTVGGASVSVNEAVRMMNRDKAMLIDVREPAEFAAGHAAGARNAPLGTLASGKGLPANKALPLVVVCATGARASRAAAQLRKAGFGSVHALAGGTAAWREANLPIETQG